MAEKQDIAKIREDFIRRLFAVSVSVGFASQLIKNPLVTGTPMTLTDMATILLMVVAMVAVATSWEGYLASVNDYPIIDVKRFYIDIIIVFAYLVLLLLAHRPFAWLVTLCAIFVLYIVWDFFRILDHKDKYGIEGVPSPACAALSLQFLFFLDKRYTEERAGPAITVTWTAYFVALTGMTCLFGFDNAYEQVAVAIAAGLGIVVYRITKTYKPYRKSWRFQLPWFSIPLMAIASIFWLNVFR